MRRINGKLTKEYQAWKNMKARCYSTCNKTHGKYYENNIQVCDRWKNSFENFLQDMGKAPNNHSLDRIDNLGNYEPNNCKWSTVKEQSCNRSDFNLKYTYNGETKILSEWAELYNLDYNNLHKRIFKSNMSFEEAIVYNNLKLIFYKGEFKTAQEWSSLLNIPLSIIYDRKSRGWASERMFEQPIGTKKNVIKDIV